MKKITLIGTVRPFGNKGDEAIYQTSIKLIRDHYPNCELFLAPASFSFDPCSPDLTKLLQSQRLDGILPHPIAFMNTAFQKTFHIQPSFKPLLHIMKFCSYNLSTCTSSLLRYWKNIDFIQEYDATDIFVVLGHPIEKIGLPTYLASYYFPKMVFKKPSIAFPLSISLLKFSELSWVDKFIRSYIKMLLEKTDVVLFREERSMKYFLEDMQANSTAILSADTAFLLESSSLSSLSDKLAKQNVFLNEPCVGVCLRQDYFARFSSYFKGKDINAFFKGIASFLDKLAEENVLNILFIPTSTNSGDYEISTEVFRLLKNRKKVQLVDTEKLSCTETKTLLGRMRFIITMRIHAAILAGSSFVPSITIIPFHDLKTFLVDDMSLSDYCLNLLEPNEVIRLLPSKVKQLEMNIDNIKSSMKEKIPRIVSRAQKAPRVLKYFL